MELFLIQKLTNIHCLAIIRFPAAPSPMLDDSIDLIPDSAELSKKSSVSPSVGWPLDCQCVRITA